MFIYIVAYEGSQMIMKDLNRIQLGKCSLGELVNSFDFNFLYTIHIKCYLCRLNKCFGNKADSLFGWGIDQSNLNQGSYKIGLVILNSFSFEPPHIKDRCLNLCNFHI